MKARFVSMFVILCAVVYTTMSCSKTAASTATTTSVAAAAASLQAIAVGSISSSASSLDSIYVINTCSRNSTKDSIAFNNMPSAVFTYLDADYSGYTAQQAYSVTDVSGAAAGYIVIIQYNGSPVGLKFDASGNFVKILEQRLGSQLAGSCGKDSISTSSTYKG